MRQNHIHIFCQSFMLIIILLLCGCTTKSPIDFKNLRPYSSDVDKIFHVSHDLNPPYAARFKTQKNDLLYIASKHDVGLNTLTFCFIKEAIKRFSPDIIILEGFEEDEGLSPKRITNHIQNVCLPKWNRCGENLYATHLALQDNINVIGAEPSHSEIFQQLSFQGYTKKDIVFFYFTRMIPQYYRQNEIRSETDLIPLFPLFVSNYMDATGCTFDDYKAWLKDKIGSKPLWEDLIDTNYTGPISSRQYLQKLANRIGFIRDKHIVKVIIATLEQHKKVMIIFGANHYPLQKDVLQQYLGPPLYFQKEIDFKRHLTNK